MFDAPIDATYAWLGLTLVATLVFGLAVRVPAAPPPDAAGVAATVDSVVASPYPATAEHPVAAESVRIRPHRVALRNGGGSAHAPITAGPVTPVDDGTALADVLRGTPPESAFDSPAEFRRALERERNETQPWEPATGAVLVRSVTWEGVDATLVGA